VNQRSQPYFFEFNFKAKPGRVICHCVRFETMDMDAGMHAKTTFTLMGADYNVDKRIRNAFDIAFGFLLKNKTTDVSKRLVTLLKMVQECCENEAWDEIDADEVNKLIQDLKL
jgi:hypothetical protein